MVFSISDLLDPEKMQEHQKKMTKLEKFFANKKLKKKLKEVIEKDNGEEINNLGVEGALLNEWGNEPDEDEI